MMNGNAGNKEFAPNLLNCLVDIRQLEDNDASYVGIWIGNECRLKLAIDEARLLAIRIIKETNQAEIRSRTRRDTDSSSTP
jgi:hypothetical protein